MYLFDGVSFSGLMRNFVPVLIVLRKELGVNIFRDLIIDSLRSGLGKEAILASGFFQEEFNKSKYKISKESGFLSALQKIELVTVGVHNKAWRASYLNFINTLKANRIKVIPKQVSGDKWHAKIYILSMLGVPKFAIIGSSNMTRRAFSTQKDFNYECDVVLWEDASVGSLVDSVLMRVEDRQGFLRAQYKEEENHGLSISKRLEHLRDEVLKVDLMESVD